MTIILYVILGLVAGALSCTLGIGGGIIIVPALVLLFGLTQQQAQGTSLAILLPPVGILAVWQYYKNGNVNFTIALYIIIGFLIGSYLMSLIVNSIPTKLLTKIFGVFFLLISLKMIFSK